MILTTQFFFLEIKNGSSFHVTENCPEKEGKERALI
jgi:hypothetical protein